MKKVQVVKVDGIPVKLGGQTYICPPIALGAVKQMRGRISSWKGGFDEASVSTVVEAAFFALRRNYPKITRAHLEEVIDFGNMVEIMEAILGVSGLRRKPQEGEVAQGEVQPG